MEARNRKLNDWYGKVQRGEIKLPRFQRFEAWDRARISSLMEMVIRNLPLGITLILEVGDEEKFVSRYLETAPTTLGRVSEQLLDGQQRLTALWRVMHNNYELETYFVDLSQFDRTEGQEEREDLSVYWRGRYVKKNGDRYPCGATIPRSACDGVWSAPTLSSRRTSKPISTHVGYPICQRVGLARAGARNDE
jgi:hypothetical protein